MTTNLPSGTVTFLFTDVERSTETVAALGNERYADVQDAHRKLLREAFATHGGAEVGTEGDAFFVAFTTPTNALRAAIDGQRALERYDWPEDVSLRVRMGMHTGEALVRDGDYVGHDVHKAKRISDAGHGGQILVSQATADLIGRTVPLRDLGLHRLKDLGEPQTIYQVCADGLGSAFPPLRSLEAFTHNLPMQRSAFIGREKELAEVRALLDANRLVTLTGVGGCGKTRLALQLAADALDSFTNGAFFVDLAPVSDPSAVMHTLATAVALPATGPADATALPLETRVVDHLAKRSSLLVLDNCEHLLDECANVVDRILGACPHIKFLATSREALEVDGERSWRVPSMSVATEHGNTAASEAVSLFEARAQTADPGFGLTTENIDAVAEICRRLDGIPLAVEFAAARVSHLSPRQIADRLDGMFELLTGGRRRVQRQQTLQAALDWSHELLSEAEQTLLHRLSVFTGSFGITAAEGICGGSVVERRAIVDLVGSLVSKSLVVAETAGDEVRYRLLETVRLYAEEKLHAQGEAETYRSALADWYHTWVRSVPLENAWIDLATYASFEREMGNIRTAMRRSRSEGRRDLVAHMLAKIAAYWGNTGNWDEALEWTTYVLEEPEAAERMDVVESLALRAFLGMWLSDGSGAHYAQRAIDLAAGDFGPGLLFAMIMLSFSTAILASATKSEELAAEARRLSDDAIALCEPMTLHITGADQLIVDGLAWVYSYRAMAETTLLNFDEAERFMLLSLAQRNASTFSLSRDPMLIAGTHSALASILHLKGEDIAAATAADASRDIITRGKGAFDWDRAQIASAQMGIAVAHAAVGRAEEARHAAREQLRGSFGSGILLQTNDALITAGILAQLLDDDPRTAYQLLVAAPNAGIPAGTATPFRSSSGYALWREHRRRAKAALDPDEAVELRARALAMTLDEAVDLARTVVGSDELAVDLA